jgi:hypothetical protein
MSSDVQPQDVLRALRQEADTKRADVGQGHIVMPNDYVVEVGDHDYQRLVDRPTPLTDELADSLGDHAEHEGYDLVGDIRVGLERAPNLTMGAFRIRSGTAGGATVDGGMIEQGRDAASDQSAAGRPMSTLPRCPRLIVTSGGSAHVGTPAARGEASVHYLAQTVTVVGRAPSCELRLDDPEVARRHAEVRHDGDRTEVVDLGTSPDGVHLNGNAVARCELVDGDRIDVGATSLIFHIDS